MMVFLSKGAKTYKVRVQHPDGRVASLTTGCRDRDDADDVEDLVRKWLGRNGKRFERLDIIDCLFNKTLSLPDAIEWYHDGSLNRRVEQLAAVPVFTPLAPLIDAWLDDKAKQKKGAGQVDTYRKQIRVLFPDDEPALADFNRKTVWARLDALDVDSPTKNRYRSCVSSFAKYLVKREVIDRNFVREIDGFGENDPRLVYYEIPDAKRLIGALPQPFAAIAALALGFCAEWGAIERTLVTDLSLDTDPVVCHVRGSKRSWRDRYVPLVPELAWTLEYIRPFVKGKMPTASLLSVPPEWRVIDVQRATANELDIHAVGEAEFGEHSIHDWRHTHIVALLRWGYVEQIPADHAGHKNTNLVRTVYGRFKPTAHDYAKAPPKAEQKNVRAGY